MTKEFIPYDLAYELYELGFDEDCLKFQWIDQDYSNWMHSSCKPYSFHTQKYWMENDDLYSISIPTFSQAFRWFREKYQLFSWVKVEYEYGRCSYGIYITGVRQSDIANGPYILYEEAELACLKKLIEIVKNK